MTITIWCAGLVIFGLLLTQRVIASNKDAAPLSSLLGQQPRSKQIRFLAFLAVWFGGLAFVSCALLTQLAS
jgi:hypothetical protein